MELIYPPHEADLLPRPSFRKPGEDFRIPEERLPVVEPSGEVIAQTTRSYAHGGSRLLHPVVHMHVIDRQGRIFLQRRASTKDLYPLKWDTAVAGHVVYTENILDALYREAEEEIGLTKFNPIFLKSFVFDSRKQRELVCVFACVGNFEPVSDCPEIIQTRWWTLDDVSRHLGRYIFTPVFEKQFPWVKDALLSLL